MKFVIASDIHGSAYWCRRLMQSFADEGANKLVLLGDILYHGPRNDLPREYAPKEVISLLSPASHEIICVRGNCEAEVDQMVLPFPVMADYAVILAQDIEIYATHGHKYGRDNPPPLPDGDILLCGHTHVPECSACGKLTYVNPGSVAIPKEGSPHSYMTLENGRFSWKDMDSGKVYMEHLCAKG